MSKRNKEKRKELWLTTARGPVHVCAGCGLPMDSVTHIGDKVEGPVKRTGGLTLCAYCGAYCIFVTETELRIASPEDLAKLDPMQRGILEKYREDIVRRKRPEVGQLAAHWLGRGKV